MVSGNEWSTASDAELVQAWINNVLTYDAIEHVGAANRQMDLRIKILRELKDRSSGSLLQLRPLLQHSDLNIRYVAALQFRVSDPVAFQDTMEFLQGAGGDIGRSAKRMLDEPPLVMPSVRTAHTPHEQAHWQPNNVPPAPIPWAEIVHQLTGACPAHADQLLRLARPAIGLWPVPLRMELPLYASRLGGMPNAPHGFVWPVAADEPMLFLGQINCADLRGLPGSEYLPSQGLLVFFGDHDTINGCMMTGHGGKVFHWPESSELEPAVPPLEILTVILACGLTFRPLIDLPHPESNDLQAILHDSAQVEKYQAFYEALRHHGISDATMHFCGFSKLLGWPDLVQSDDLDLFLDTPVSARRLLLQLDGYSNGKEFQDWGPGGSLYFLIDETDFANGDFEAAQLTGQFT